MPIKGPVTPMTAMSVDPVDSRVLYAAAGPQLLVSANRGKSWNVLGEVAPGRRPKILVDPNSNSRPGRRTVYVIGSDRVYVLENDKWRRNDPPPGSKGLIMESTGGFPPGGGPPLIYILTSREREGSPPRLAGGLLLSRDGGATWLPADNAIRDILANPSVFPVLRGLAAAPQQPETLYVSYSGLRFKTGPEKQVFRSRQDAERRRRLGVRLEEYREISSLHS